MKLVRFTQRGRTAIGVVQDERITDITLLFPHLGHDMRALLACGDSQLAEIRKALARNSERIEFSTVA